MILMMLTNSLLIEMCIYFKLLRFNNWVVTSFFMLLNACCGFTYDSIESAIVCTCMAWTVFILFLTYKSPGDVRHTYYGYLAIGIASLFFIPILYFVPLLWIIGAFQLQSLNWRSWLASLIGILTPYWFTFPWYLYLHSQETDTIHFPLVPLETVPDSGSPFMPIQIIVFVLIIILTTIGIFNFWNKSYQENIQTRLFFGFLQWMGMAVVVAIILLPQHFYTLIRMLLLFASPYVAHFFALSRSKIINYVFFISMTLIIVLSIISTHQHSMLNDVNTAILEIWNG